MYSYFQLWEESQVECTRLRFELGEVKTDLESVRSQLEAMAIQVTDFNNVCPALQIVFHTKAVNHKSLSDSEKREKKIVVKKLEEMEEELKVGQI